MLHHANLQGLDLRYCQQTTISTSFAEAQDSLMAGSLDDLQHVNVMVEGGGGNKKNESQSQSYSYSSNASSTSNGTSGSTNTTSNSTRSAKVDSMNGLGDCWVEFRANMKHPLGFLHGMRRRQKGQRGVGSSTKRVAKAPDIPYE